MSRVSRRTRDSETCSSGRDIQIFRLNIYLRVWGGGGGDRSLPTCYSKRRGSWKIHLRFKDREEEGGSWLIAGRGDSRKKLCVYIYRGSLLISELENLFKKFLTKGIFDTIQFKGNSSTKEFFFRVLSKIFLSSPFIFGWKGKNGDCLFLSLLKRDLKRARGINRWRGMEKSRGGGHVLHAFETRAFPLSPRTIKSNRWGELSREEEEDARRGDRRGFRPVVTGQLFSRSPRQRYYAFSKYRMRLPLPLPYTLRFINNNRRNLHNSPSPPSLRLLSSVVKIYSKFFLSIENKGENWIDANYRGGEISGESKNIYNDRCDIWLIRWRV